MSSVSSQIIGINSGASEDIGAKADAAVTDPASEASIIAVLKGLLTQMQGGGSGSNPVTLTTQLSSEYDTINVSKMSKSGVTIAHNAITASATSAEIDCRGFNAVSVECEVSSITSGNWLIEILGNAISGGTFGNCFTPKDDGTFVQQKTPVLTINETTTYYFRGIPNYVKIRATRTTDGTLTCKVTPMNL